MLERLAAVCLAHATRRLLWVWALGYVAMLLGGVAFSHSTRHDHESIHAASVPSMPVAGISGHAELQRIIAEKREAQVEALDCGREWSKFGAALEIQRVRHERGPEVVGPDAFEQLRTQNPLPEFDRFPALRALDLTGCVIFPVDAKRIAKCRQLEWLSLERAVIIDRDFNFLSGMDRLETLILATVQSAPERPLQLEKTALPRLRTLVLDGSIWDMPPALAALAESPQWHDLVIRTRLWEGVEKNIRAIPALRRVFIGGYQADPAAFRQLKAELPQLAVWHAELGRPRPPATIFLFFTTLWVTGGWLAQLQVMMSLPAAWLWPKYVWPHYLVPLVMTAVGLFVNSLVARGFGVDLWAAFAFAAFSIGAFTLFAVLGERLQRIALPLRRREPATAGSGGGAAGGFHAGPLVGIPMVLSVLGGIAYLVTHGYVLEGYALGEFPYWSLGLFGAGLASLGAAAVMGTRLSASLCESGMAPMLSLRNAEERGQKAGRMPRAATRRLMSLPRSPVPSTWSWQVRAFRAGNPSPLGQLPAALVGVLVPMMFALSMVQKSIRPSSLDLGLGTFVGLVAYLCGMRGYINAMLLWQRRRAFESELHYPWTRRQMTLAVFGTFLRDSALLLVLPLALVVGLAASRDWKISTDMILAGTLAATAAIAMLSAGALWLLTLRHALLAVLVGGAGGYALVVAVGFSMFGVIREEELFMERLPLALLGSAVESTLIAILLAVGAYIRWTRTEWALIR